MWFKKFNRYSHTSWIIFPSGKLTNGLNNPHPSTIKHEYISCGVVCLVSCFSLNEDQVTLDIEGFVQDSSYSGVLAMDLMQPRTKRSMWYSQLGSMIGNLCSKCNLKRALPYHIQLIYCQCTKYFICIAYIIKHICTTPNVRHSSS